MITFSKFGKHGRLGNQLFQYAALIGLSRKYNREIVLPEWVYSKYFEYESNTGFVPAKKIEEPAFHYTPDFYDAIFKDNSEVDLHGYFQSEKYWEDYIFEVMVALDFKKEFMAQLEYEWPIENAKQNIAISVRRGDYVNNPNYELLPITYYFLALHEHFPDFENYNLIIFSDDPDYCSLHFGCLDNAYIIPNNFDNMNKSKYFDENRSAMAQLAMMSLCDHFIIANSTFSWWGAYLGEKSGSKIIRPAHHFNGKLKEQCDIRDHYPERWISFDHKDQHGNNKKIDLGDVTFTIPVSYDHLDRKQNLGLNVCLLQRYFQTEIIIGEQGSDKFNYFSKYCQYRKFNYSEFHRTRMLNEMAKMCDTSIFANWDADVFVAPIQIWKAVETIRTGADIVYPYDGRFARVDRIPWFLKLEKSLDIGIIGSTVFKGMRYQDKKSVGGAIFCNTQSFLNAGGENEKFIAYGPEDIERWERFRKIDLKVVQITGVLYHLDHWCGPNSKCSGNKYDKQNHDELEKIQTLSKQELLNYITTWNQTQLHS